MPKINQIPIPNVSIFEPVTSVYENNLSYVEFLLGILKKVNEILEQTNVNTEFIEEYSGKIEELENSIAQLRTDVTNAINEQTNTIDTRFAQIEAELNNQLRGAIIECKQYSDNLYRILDAKIDQVAVGQINVYDPTTGVISPLQDVLNNLAGNARDDSLTADEYDGLDLTASQYDGYDISAFDYDYHAKSLLI